MIDVKYESPVNSNPFVQSWSVQMGQLVSVMGKIEFEQEVVRILNDTVPFDHFTAYRYCRGEKPIPLFHTVVADRADHLVYHYAADAFRLDPFSFAANERSSGEGVIALRTLSPQFEKSEYFHNFYRDTHLSDEVGFLVRLSGDQSLVMSLLRDAGMPQFNQAERDQLCWREPLMRELFRQQWRQPKGREPMQPAIVEAAHSGVAHLLSRREFEIVSLIVTGHSSEAIASILDISLGTVKVHRKNIYRKLNISSQNELYHLCLTSRALAHH
jgi:DNA-binding CsgD family transcriptional regulator